MAVVLKLKFTKKKVDHFHSFTVGNAREILRRLDLGADFCNKLPVSGDFLLAFGVSVASSALFFDAVVDRRVERLRPESKTCRYSKRCNF